MKNVLIQVEVLALKLHHHLDELPDPLPSPLLYLYSPPITPVAATPSSATLVPDYLITHLGSLTAAHFDLATTLSHLAVDLLPIATTHLSCQLVHHHLSSSSQIAATAAKLEVAYLHLSPKVSHLFEEPSFAVVVVAVKVPTIYECTSQLILQALRPNGSSSYHQTSFPASQSNHTYK